MEQRRLSGGASLKSPRFKAKRTAAQRYEQNLAAEQTEIARQIYAKDPTARVFHRFHRLVNALAVELDASQIGSIQEIPGVAYVTPLRRVKPMLTNSAELMNLPQAWAPFEEGENAGEGIFIAVIDTGVDVTHPALSPAGYSYPEGFPKGDADFTTEKVIAARVFPPPIGDPGDAALFDRTGHGTNVATIAAGNWEVSSPLGILSGAAPKAQLGNYKVFTTDESYDSQVVEAIESAVEDGADVINMSLGAGIFGDAQHDLQVRAVNNAIDLGVVVVIASGNDGGEEYAIGSPAQAEDAITVGSITNSHVSNGNPPAYDVYLTAYSDGALLVDKILAVMGEGSGPFMEPIIGVFPLQDVDLIDGREYGGENDGLACDPLDSDVRIDGWALISAGGCESKLKVEHAALAGADGVIFINEASQNTLSLENVEGTAIPGLLIDHESGLLIKESLANGSEVVVEIQGVPISARFMKPNQLSSFSAKGPSVNYSLKPDVVTIGEGSFAGAQNDDTNRLGFNASGFQWLSGTSMSAPRVSGLAAILRQLHPDWPPAWIKSAIMLSARKEVQKKNGLTAAVLERGAGAVDGGEAARVDVIAVPAMINFGVHMVVGKPPAPRWITVVNASDHIDSYTLQPADAENSHGILISEGQFDLASGEKKEIEVIFPSISDLSNGDYEGDLVLTNSSENQSHRIPYWLRIHFVQGAFGEVLLVDDDNGQFYEDYYMDRLEEISASYSWWDVNSAGYPTLDYLSEFNTVLWFMSDHTLNSVEDPNSPAYRRMYNPRHLFESDLMKYLTEGGSLFLSAQDYSDDKETSVFTREVLSVSTRDRENGARTIQGLSNHPVSDGLGPFVMTFPDGFENWPDYLSPIDFSRTERAFIADGSRSRNVGVTIDACTYRAVFLAFPLETLDANAGNLILQRSLQWLGEREAASPPELVSVTPNTITLTEESGPFSLVIQGSGFEFASGYRAFLDFEPISDLQREDCFTLTGSAPAGIKPGTYSLRLVSGDGHDLRLANALTVYRDANANVLDWALF
ncbi:MAG: S8 family serine peptidase [Candidatus Omnitrophica bacterium]|nr:S8 family serine peptidase [Candidatus Omnitrophota bacterium]